MTIETIAIAHGPDLQFRVDVAGPSDGQPVLLLHGFPESRLIWEEALRVLADAGYRAIAPDQRGYSPGARPDPANLANYAFDRLLEDALAIADGGGAAGGRFHLVGHDWGGHLAWGLADRHADRLLSLSVLSRPHPGAFLRAYLDPDGVQKNLSRHHGAFLDPNTTTLLMENDAKRLRRLFAGHGVADPEIERQLSVIGDAAALEAALAWYRSNSTRAEMGRTRVPTLYVWGDADGTIGAKASRGTADFVEAPYRFEVLPGVGHFVMDQAPREAARLILDHIRENTP